MYTSHQLAHSILRKSHAFICAYEYIHIRYKDRNACSLAPASSEQIKEICIHTYENIHVCNKDMHTPVR